MHAINIGPPNNKLVHFVAGAALRWMLARPDSVSILLTVTLAGESLRRIFVRRPGLCGSTPSPTDRAGFALGTMKHRNRTTMTVARDEICSATMVEQMS